MSKKILVLTGSPRKGGNSDLMADAFIKGAQAAGHAVTKYETGLKKINGCKACNECYSKGDACVFRDDFNTLAPLMEQSDVLVLATPMYWFTFPAQLKAALDKMYALLIGGRQSNIKESILLACAETTEEADFDGLVRTYGLIASYQKWTDLAHLLVPSVVEKGDILHTDALRRAEELGLSLI
ncbi:MULTISPECIES: flavodoxin family protein [unclassified Methanoculleus]|jgi:multimeric flavodoxin WrbA|uniref:flavodoxin family protein n=1 Tax=unclassified Methanoculleus TaxID=2619537 RepID=UPI0025EB4372|nr:flavodoxin family protein [Methanoculleus sp. UBA377]MDD2472570.1 flavodoxin family protein [Methanoculleus sp.]